MRDIERGNFEVGDMGDDVSHLSDPPLEATFSSDATNATTMSTASGSGTKSAKKKFRLLSKLRKKIKFRRSEDSRSTMSETTPLVGQTTASKSSPKKKSMFSTPFSRKKSSDRAKMYWNKVKMHLHSGDFLLRGAMGNSRFQQSSDDRKSLVQERISEIRAGMEFSLSHGLAAILIYLALAIVCYNFIFEPEWSIIDSCYFAVTTFTTVGYGDEVPTTETSMIFTCLYALTGVACLGIALGILGSNLIDAEEKAMSSAGELNKKEILRVFDTSTSSNLLTTGNDQESKLQEEHNPTSQSNEGLHFFFKAAPLLGILFALAFIIGRESGWDTPQTMYYLIITGTPITFCVSYVGIGCHWNIFFFCLPLFKINPNDFRFQFATTATTVGYGDLAPTTPTAKLMSIFFIPLACGTMGQWLGVVANWIIEGRSARFRKQMGNRELTQRDLEIMDINGDGVVSRAEFLEFMLVAMNKIDQELVDELRDHFNKLDVDGTGELSRDDLVEAARRKLKQPVRKLELAAYKRRILEQGRRGPATQGVFGPFLGGSNPFMGTSFSFRL